MSNPHPRTNDPDRAALEREAIQARDKAEQVAEALREGKLPSNQQITSAIETIQESDVIYDSARGMSPLGKRVLVSTEKLLESTKKLLEEKNVGDELQNIFYYGSQATRDASDSATIPQDMKQKVSTEASTSQSMIQDAIKEVILIPQLLITSSEFRKLINDIHSIIQDSLLRNVPGKEPPTETGPELGTDQEKSIQEAKQETKQQARESTYPVAKTAAKVSGAHIKEFSEGNKSLQEAATGGAKELAMRVKDTVVNIQLTEEQRDKLVERFKNVMIETQSRPEYQQALSNIINIVSCITQQSKEVSGHVANKTKTQVQESTDEESLQIAKQNAKDLIENFANRKSLDPLINALRELGSRIKTDEDLRSYFKDLQDFILSSLRDTQFVQQTDYREHGSRLIDTGRHLLLERYSDTTQHIVDEASAFNQALQEDRTTAQWTSDFENLIRDMFLDERGQPTVKFELIKDFGKIIPVVADKLKYLPLPRIENSDEEYDYIFDNVVLYLSELMPKHLHMSFTSDINLDREENDVVQNTAFIEISKLRADARNIAFYYKKKKGLINMMDVGLVDFSIPKNGLTIKVKLLLNLPSDSNPSLDIKVLEADTTIDSLTLKLHDTKHDFLYILLTPLVEKRLKKQLANMVTDKVIKFFNYVKDSITNLQSQVGELQKKSLETKRKDKGAVPQGSEEKLKQSQAWQSPAFNPALKAREE
ncbi:12595_t:CDS:2 [Funneliformis geosporum]|uniref:2962_t:CDS:1 n=1 Tax=Funneliformis geosporum TaxID=1117311 RepID=A0A9W4SY12_9GLOM|nr:2962_t:CDS:2 [Funneliformis geosporum]CAI2185968.1 12595_t:CDS:2 [Funneliformis geosporum]